MSDAKAPASLAEALAALQAQMPVVAKHSTAKAGTFSYAYAPGEDITPKVYPLMSALGLSFSASPTMLTDLPGQFVLKYSLLHVNGDEVGGLYPLPDPARLGPQDLGKAITYARRYALCALIGLFPGGDDTDATADGKPIDTPARKSRAVPDAQLASEGRMTRAQKSAHEHLEADTKRGNGTKAERSRPRHPDPDSDPWAVDAPVDRHRARALREHIDLNPEDRPGSISEGQHRAIERMLGMLGFKPAERKDRHGHAALRLGLDQLPVNPASAPDSGPSMLGLSAAQAAALIRALQDDLDDLKNAERADA